MQLLNEIREGFANLQSDSWALLRETPDHPAWVYRNGGSYGVAIEVYVDAPIISERFSGVYLYRDGVYLKLECKNRILRNEFAIVCMHFLDPSSRNELVSSPTRWWKNWRELLGNSIREPNAYSVLGELLAFEFLLNSGQNPEWIGAKSGSQDIETDQVVYEVKSTLSRYQSVVTISSQFQLQPHSTKPTVLIHQRFEPSHSGDSIDASMQRLAASSEVDELEQLLERLGYEKGSSARRDSYKLLESRSFPVNEDFPRIVPTSFKNDVIPEGILGLRYDVDLTSLPAEPFIVGERPWEQ